MSNMNIRWRHRFGHLAICLKQIFNRKQEFISLPNIKSSHEHYMNLNAESDLDVTDIENKVFMLKKPKLNNYDNQ